MKMKRLIFLVFLWMGSTSTVLGSGGAVQKFWSKSMPDNMIWWGPYFFIPVCGVGSFILPRDSWLSTYFASALNSTFSSSAPLSTTFNVSECIGPKEFVQNDDLEKFAKDNMELLASNIADGGGETLAAFAELAGVPESERGRFYRIMQNNYALIFPAGTGNVDVYDVVQSIGWVTADRGITNNFAREFTVESALSF